MLAGGRPAARPDNEPSIATFIRAFTVVIIIPAQTPDSLGNGLPDLDQLDGFVAGAFDHQGAGVAEAVGLLEEGHAFAL